MEINTFERKYGIGEFRKHERLLAREDISGLFINTSFIEDGNVLTAIYRFDGYLKASECRFKSQLQILNLVEKVLELIRHASDFYISSDRIEISVDTIFYRPSDEDVRMAFIPSLGNSFRDELIDFCNDMKIRFTNGDTSGIDMLICYLYEQPITFDSIAMEIHRIKTEIIF